LFRSNKKSVVIGFIIFGSVITMSILSYIRVLIVDDHEEMAELIAMMLRRPGVEVSIVLDGESALDHLAQNSPDVIVTDLMMPNMDGFELMERVLQQDPKLPVVVVTAHGSMKSAVRAMRIGAFDFITKPFEQTDVRQTVKRAARLQIDAKYEALRQKITDALGITRELNQIGHKLLTYTSEGLQTDHSLIWWPDTITPPLLLDSQDTAVASALIDFTQVAGILEIDGLARIKKSIDLEIPDQGLFSGSAIAVPLMAQKELEGVLILASEKVHYFDEADLAFLDRLAPFTGLAIDNAKTYSKLAITNERLSSLQRISALTYNAKVSLNRMLRLVVEGIRQNLNYRAVMLHLPDQGTSSLTIRAAGGDLDRFLHRRGDSPTRRIAFSWDDKTNPICQAFHTRTVQEGGIETWIRVLKEAGAPDIAKTISQFNLARYIFFPLWQGEEVIGVLGLGHQQNQELPLAEFNLLTSVANQTALVIKNASLYQTEQQGRREMEALYQAGLVIASSLSQSEVLRTIIEQIVGLTFFESCIIGRWDERKDAEVVELYLKKTARGWLEKDPPGTVYPLRERPLVSDALRQKTLRVIRIDDPSLTPSERIWMDQAQAHLRLIIPLIIRDRCIGVLELFTTQPNRQFSDHISRITQGLAAQAVIALENARLYESEMKRIEQEMDLAQRIQISLLPHQTPQIPGLTIAARSISARLVGGDFYRYLTLPNGNFGVVVGDVSGKGVPAALYMAMTVTAIDTQIVQQDTPNNMLQELNNVLYPRMKANRMNTALLVAIFDPEDISLQVANAGMIAPLIRHNLHYDWLDVSGLPIGATQGAVYTSQATRLRKRSTVILMSDGIIEAQNKSGEIYGFDRFQEAAQRLQNITSSQQILDSIWADVSTHIGDAEPHDDMTMVVMQTWDKRGSTQILPELP
ncbi:MAG: SpoIIE family protein phosphatase, partial [Chloroflexota bacterium]